MKIQPTKDPQIVTLIHAVRRNPSLYDYRLPQYSNDAYNDGVWQLIADQCNLESVDVAKMYWRKLQHSFSVFYRNELIRLVRANYDVHVIGALPEEQQHTSDERFGNRTWGYYGDMRFIAPFRIKGTDPELERLIELAKPIVMQSDAGTHKFDTASGSRSVVLNNAQPEAAVTAATAKSITTAQNEAPHLSIPAVCKEELSDAELCLSSFFDAMFRATRTLPTHLQRRVKREFLQTLHNAEAEAEEMEAQMQSE